MNRLRRTLLLAVSFLLLASVQGQQYVLNGSAQQLSCNCYQLTANTATQRGSVWNANKISLQQPFDFWFNVYLGCNDANGADGIVFILQPLSTSVGSSGEGMGFGGVFPSVGIALDTYRNANLADPDYDHISIQINGNINHSNDLAGPVPVSAVGDNVEDCQWHRLRISWDPATKWLRTYFDGVLRLEKQVDLVTTVFNNDPNVYWGFSGATGGSTNVQQFCTALDPIFSVGLTNNVACVGNPVLFTNASESFAPIASYHWDFGDGQTSTLQQPPPHVYTQPGNYPVKLTITGLDGCTNDSVQTVIVPGTPQASFEVFDTCFTRIPRIAFGQPNFGVNYQWRLDGQPYSSDPTPQLFALSAGTHQLQVVVSSAYGCGVNDTATRNFVVKPIPEINATMPDGCVHETLTFLAQQTDQATQILQWAWSFGDAGSGTGPSVQHAYAAPGNYVVKAWALAGNGCLSDTVRRTIRINAAWAFAGNDTTVVLQQPFLLHGNGNGAQFLWTPATGLSDASIPDPTLVLDGHRDYVLTVTTAEGCTASDTIRIKAYKGPAVYVPTAFTPNGDGLNDAVVPVYVGLKKLDEFAIYNRWGQCVFRTLDRNRGWDGGGTGRLATQTFVWMARGVNDLDQPVTYKGTITLIR